MANPPGSQLFPTTNLVPQGAVLADSPRGAPMVIMDTLPQRPMFGPGLISNGTPAALALLPAEGPIRRGM